MGKAFDKVKEFFGVSDDEYSEDNYIEENSASEIEEKAAVKKENAPLLSSAPTRVESHSRRAELRLKT